MEGDCGNTRGPGQLQTRFRRRCYYHSGGDTEPDETQAEAEACLHQSDESGRPASVLRAARGSINHRRSTAALQSDRCQDHGQPAQSQRRSEDGLHETSLC